MLGNNAKLAVLACSIIGSLLHSLPAAAYDCDSLQMLNNKSRLIGFWNYEMDWEANGSGLVAGDGGQGGGCQPGTLTVQAPQLGQDIAGGDGTVTRYFSVQEPGNSTLPPAVTRFSTRFDISLPVQTYNPGTQSLAIRQLKLTPFTANDMQSAMTLTLFSSDGGVNWFLASKFTYVANGVTVQSSLPNSPLLMDYPGAPDRRIGVRIDYLWNYLGDDKKPEIRTTYFHGGVARAMPTYTLPKKMALLSQTQGLIEMSNLKPGTAYFVTNIANCVDYGAGGNCSDMPPD